MVSFLTNFFQERSELNLRVHSKFLLLFLVFIIVFTLSFLFTPKATEYLPGDFTSIANAKDSDKLDSMQDISKEVSKDGLSEDTEDGKIAGNQWSALGSDSSFFAEFTKATKKVSYSDLKSEGKDSALSTAGAYGFVLHSSGLDHSFVEGDPSAVFAKLGRIVAGAIMFIAFFTQSAVNYLFSFLITVADYINVFRWFSSEAIDPTSPFSSVQEIVGGVLNPIKDLGIIVLSIIFVFSLGLAFLGWKASGKNPRTSAASGMTQALMKFFLRVFIILVGPLFISVIFSFILTETKEAYKGTSASDYAIYSNLIDFDKWAKHSRLALPGGESNNLEKTLSSGEVSYVSHKEILDINADGAGLKNARDTRTAYENHKETTISGTQDVDLDEAKNGLINNYAMAILSKWMTLDEVTSASYESFAKNNYINSGGKLDNKTYSELISTDGSLSVKPNGKFTTMKPQPAEGNTSNNAQTGAKNSGGLSSLGMYNFLSTTFGSDAFTFTRTDLMIGKAFTPYHASVGLAGRGFIAFGNFLLMLSTVASIAILGFIFAYRAVVCVFTSIPQAIASMGAASFGSIKYFVKMLVIVFTVGLELIGGAVFYMIFQKLIEGVTQLGDKLAGKEQTIFSLVTDNVALAGSLGNTAYGTINIVIAVLLLFLSIRLISIRASIFKGMGSAFEGVLSNLFGILDSSKQPAMAGGMGNKSSNLLGNSPNGGTGLARTSNDNGPTSDFSKQKAQLGEGEGEDGTRGAIGSRNPSPNGPRSNGRAKKSKADLQNAIRAKEAELGRPLTNAEKRKELAKQQAAKQGAKALGMVGALADSETLRNAGKGIESKRQDKINEGLDLEAKHNADANDLSKGAINGDSGKTKELQDLEDYSNAESNLHGNGSEVESDSINHVGAAENNENASVVDSSGMNTESSDVTGIEAESGEHTSAVGSSLHNSDVNGVEAENGEHTSAIDSAQRDGDVNDTSTGNVQSSNNAVIPAFKPTGDKNHDNEGASVVSKAKEHEQAKKSLATAEKDLAKAKQSGDPQAIKSAQQRVDSAKQRVAQTGKASASASKEFANKAKEKYATAKSAEKTATDKLQHALANPNTTTPEQLDALKQDVANKQQATKSAKANLQQANGLIARSKSVPKESGTTTTSKSGTTSSSTGKGNVQSKQQAKNSIPKFASVGYSNNAVKQSSARLNQLKQLASVAPVGEKAQYDKKIQQASRQLKQVQAGASNLYNSQPAKQMARSSNARANVSKVAKQYNVAYDKNNPNQNLNNPSNLTNGAARKHLVAIRDAEVNYRNVAQMKNPSPNALLKAKKELGSAKFEAYRDGLDERTYENPSAIKQSLETLNRSQTEYVRGTGKES